MKAIKTKTSSAVIIRNENIERYLKEVKKEIKFSYEEERELIKRAQLGSIIDRNKLIEAHLKFVISCAKEYQCKNIEMSDLIEAGNEGLILAVEKFDLKKETRFLTCAVWWIRYKLYDFVAQNFSLIQIPLNQQGELRKIKREKEILENKFKTELVYSEVIALSKDPEKVSGYFNYVLPSITCSSEFESLDKSINDKTEECTLYQLLPSEVSTDSILEREDRVEIIKSYINKLSKVQKEVIILYYGLNDRIEKTDSDVARLLGFKNLTSEGVHQIRLKGLEKLKNIGIMY